jgi:L-arabinose isomerase
MTNLKKYEIWFVTGSQDLYGNETLQKVASHARIIVQSLDNAPQIPVIVTFKEVVKNPDEIYKICQAANTDANCVGIVAWMHTFSPARMWIRGLKALQKPLLHLHTQFNRDIPWDNIDMDFMNLNQSAHGDREFGFMMTRMRLNRKVVVGHWQDPTVLERLNVWMRAAVARFDWQGAKFCRFGDNMRQVAVTEGDKVEAELQFGYSVNGHGIGDLAAYIQQISDTAITKLVQEYH